MYCKILLISIITICLLLNSSESLNSTAIVVMHGRGENRFNGLTYNFIQYLRKVLIDKSLDKEYNIINIGLSDDNDTDENWTNYKTMTFQLEMLSIYVQNETIWKQLENSTRIVLVGCSQGSLLIRGLLWNKVLDPFIGKMDKLITFGGPNNGLFDIPECSTVAGLNTFELIICNVLENTYKASNISPSIFDGFMYTIGLEFAFGDYWNSPSPLSRVLRLNTYLAKLNNENPKTPIVKEKYLSQKLNSGLVMISFGNDEVVLPSISTTYGYWDLSGKKFIPYTETDLYKCDLIGLKTLDLQNKTAFYTIANHGHMFIPLDFVEDKFLDFIK